MAPRKSKKGKEKAVNQVVQHTWDDDDAALSDPPAPTPQKSKKGKEKAANQVVPHTWDDNDDALSDPPAPTPQKSRKGKEKAASQVVPHTWGDDDYLFDPPAPTPRRREKQQPLMPITPETPRTMAGPSNPPPAVRPPPAKSYPTPTSGIVPKAPRTGGLLQPPSRGPASSPLAPTSSPLAPSSSPLAPSSSPLAPSRRGGLKKTVPRAPVAGNNNDHTNSPPPEDKGPIPPATDDASAPAEETPSRASLKRPYEFTLRMSHGWTVGDGTFDPVPQDKRRKRDVPYPNFVSHSYRSRSALSSLQLSHDAPISLCALDIACQHLWKCMPGAARKYLYISAPNGPALWGGNDESKTATMYEKMDDKIYHLPVGGTNETEYRHYTDLKRRPWVIWPLWIEDQWGSDFVTVIWHSRPAADDADLFNQLVSYAIIDPRRSEEPDESKRHQPIKDRLARIQGRLMDLWRRAGFNVQNAESLDIYCSPMPFNEATSGERCFAVIKELINQIINWQISGMKFNHDTTVTSTARWVNPFQQRVELTGICAWILMASLDYNARIAVEAILPDTRWDVTSNGEKKHLRPYDLAGSYTEPPIASHDYLLPAGKEHTASDTQKDVA